MIGADGEQLGVMSPDEGREHAKDAGFDLVEVAPNARPPVCKIMDYGKYRYEQSKKKAASKASKTSSMTLRMRPNIEQHDLNTKMRKAMKTLEKGGQVRLVMRMRGRERAVPGRWVTRLNEIIADMRETLDREVEVTQRPKAEGRQITATIDPR